MRKPTTLLAVLAAGLSCQNSRRAYTRPRRHRDTRHRHSGFVRHRYDFPRPRARSARQRREIDPVTLVEPGLEHGLRVNAAGKVQAPQEGHGHYHGWARVVDGPSADQREDQRHPSVLPPHRRNTLRRRHAASQGHPGSLPTGSFRTTFHRQVDHLRHGDGARVALRPGHGEDSRLGDRSSAQVDSAVAHAALHRARARDDDPALGAHLDTLHQDSTFFSTGGRSQAAGDTLMNRAFTWTSRIPAVAKLYRGSVRRDGGRLPDGEGRHPGPDRGGFRFLCRHRRPVAVTHPRSSARGPPPVGTRPRLS